MITIYYHYLIYIKINLHSYLDTLEEDKYGSKQITGYSEYWKANNIYDIAGNCTEWTQEASLAGLRAFRGGDYNDNGSNSPPSCRTQRLSYRYQLRTRTVLVPL